jgi:hypothetical protein
MTGPMPMRSRDNVIILTGGLTGSGRIARQRRV